MEIWRGAEPLVYGNRSFTTHVRRRKEKERGSNNWTQDEAR
jgi:hypothetical protein